MNYIDAASGIVTLSKWLSGAQVEREHSTGAKRTLDLCTGRPLTEIPDAASIQFNLLMMSL